MKILKISFFAILALLTLGVVAAFIFLKNFDVERFKPQIVAQLSSTLNRKVDIGKMDLKISWSQGAMLTVRNVIIGDDPQFSEQAFVSIGKIFLKVNLSALIRERKIEVLQVVAQAPKIVLIRNAQGKLNTETLAQPSQQEGNAAESPASGGADGSISASSSNKSAGLMMPMDFLISSVVLEDGQLSYTDRMFTPPIAMDIRKIDAKIDNVALGSSSPFELQSALWSTSQNIRLNGLAAFDLETQQVSISFLVAETDISDLSFEEMKKSLPMLAATPLKGNPAGILKLKIEKMVAGPSGLSRLSGNASLSEGNINIEGLAKPIDRIGIEARFTESKINVDPLTAHIGSGAVKGKATLSDYLNQRNFFLDADIDNIDLKEMIDQSSQPVQFFGKLVGNVRMEGSLLDPDMFLKSLQGSAGMEIQNGQLKDFNVLKMVFDKISLIPDLVTRLENSLPQKYKDLLQKNETNFSKLSARFVIKNQNIDIEDAVIQGDGFGLNAKASVDLQQNLFVRAALYIPADLSASMQQNVDALQYFLDSQQQIFIPLKEYRGPLAAYKPFPDIEYLAGKFTAQKGRQELEKVLNKVLKTDEPASVPEEGAATPSENGSDEPPKETKDPKKELINNVLDAIFSK